MSVVKKSKSKAFQPPSPPPILSGITAPRPGPVTRKTKVPYVDHEHSTQGAGYSDMDEGMSMDYLGTSIQLIIFD